MRVTRGALVAHRYTYEGLRCRTSQYSRTFIPLSVSFWNDLANRNRSMVWACWIQEQGQCFFIGLSSSIPNIVFYFFPLSLLSVYWLVLCGWGLRTDRVYTLSQLCTADFLKIIITIKTDPKIVPN